MGNYEHFWVDGLTFIASSTELFAKLDQPQTNAKISDEKCYDFQDILLARQKTENCCGVTNPKKKTTPSYGEKGHSFWDG